MSARDVLVATLEDVNETQVPDDLRAIAFSKVFDLRAGGAAAPRGGGQRQSHPPVPDLEAGDPGDPLGQIAAKVQAKRETVGEVYDLRDDNVELIIPGGKLSGKTASATKEIALLVAGGRQAAGTEEWTPIDRIRDVCADFKKLDSGNFAKTVRSMEDVFNFRKESERKTSVKLARPGWDSFSALVRRLGGES